MSEGDRSQLAVLDQGRQALAQAKSMDDFIGIRDYAERMRYLMKQANYSLEAQNDAAELKLRAERALGELLAETIVQGSHNTKLPEGVSPMQSHRWQAVASVPVPVFEQHVAAVKDQSAELTTASVLQLAKDLKRQQKKDEKDAEPEDDTPPVHGIFFQVDQGDCLSWFAAQEADSINLVFGSPPYEQARLYLEEGSDLGIARGTEAWVAWMVEVYKAALRCCTGLVAFVVEGQTKDYCWTASPALLIAALVKEGITVRKPPIYKRVGIPGSGGPDWLRNDYEFIVCATRGGQLPWSDNTAMGKPPKFEPGGDPTHRTQDGSRVNGTGYASMEDRANLGPHRARQQAGRIYVPPERANPGNVISCVAGGGNMGSPLCHENEAPFPESLVEFFVNSFCQRGDTVCDPFSGSGTTGAVTVMNHRRFVGCDVRASQVKLSRKRIGSVQPRLPLED